MKPPARQYFTITGINGITIWPSSDIVVNTAPVSDVIIDNLPTENFFAVNVLSHGSVVDTIAQSGGLITLPAPLFDNAFDNRISLVLLRDSAAYLGKISFLPSSISVPFDRKGYLDANGNFVSSNGSRCTDFVSVEDVTDIVVTGKAATIARCLVAYDENKAFKSVILGSGDFDHVHIIPDGSYAYVRCTSANSADHSLEVYYRRRH